VKINSIMFSVKIRGLIAATGVLGLSIFLFSGCKNLMASSDSPAAPPVSTAPAAPLVVDGARTSYADIVDKVAPAVVKVSFIHKEKAPKTQDGEGGGPGGLPFPFPFGGGGGMPQQRGPSIQRGVGSGAIVSADGTILTNNHVIEGADKVKVELTDKRSFDAKVVGADKLSDLAVLKIEANDLPFIALGDSDKVRIGDVVLAIGNPLDIGQTVTAGIISAKGRRTGLSDGSFADFLQTDAPINQGNSGGPLINVSGELIGINSQILSSQGSGGGNIGIGFSIPSNMARNVMDQLIKDGKVHRGQLGVIVQNLNEDLAEGLGIKSIEGVVVSDVKSGSPADKAGVKQSDVITMLNGEKIDDSNVLRNKIAATAPGSDVTLKIIRDGKEQDIKATLAEASTDQAAGEEKSENPKDGDTSSGGKLGVTVEPLDAATAKQLGLPGDTRGLAVAEVDPNGPAAEAGIREGDVILSVNRTPVTTAEQMQQALKSSPNKALLLVNRRGQSIFLPVPLDGE
jgi:serine protease Do